jgi:phosphogluconate dehydratase
LGVLQDRGFNVALVTDGRMSGASGKVPAAIHLYPEAKEGGFISKIEDGDWLRLDCHNGRLELLVEDEVLQARPAAQQAQTTTYGMGRELFSNMRQQVSSAELGASICS